MLELLRKDASKFFSKILLGLIVAVFVLYFGFNFTGGGRGQGGLNNPAGVPIAKVNGENIPSGKFQMELDRQTKFYQQFNQGNLPKEFQEMLQTRVLDQLIQESLFAEEAYQVGLRVSDEELAQDILSDRNFQKEGVFDENFYLNQFKPFYGSKYGQDYEAALRQELLAGKLQDLLEKSAIVSNQAVNNLLALQGLELTVKKLDIPIDAMGPDQAQPKAVEVAKQWIQLKKDKKGVGDLLKAQPAAKESELTDKNLYELLVTFGQEDALPVMLCLIGAKPGEICAEPFQIGKTIVAVELLQKKEIEIPAEKKLALQTQLAQARKNQVIGAAKDLLLREAKIQTYLGKN